MPNQRDIANALKLNQSTVSRALRGDPKLPLKLRQRVTAQAKQLGYSESPLVRALMTQVRARRKLREMGCIALVVPAMRRRGWETIKPLVQYQRGAERRATELGYHLDRFFPGEDGLSFEKLDMILEARGIRGVILAPPWQRAGNEKVRWERYVCVGTGWKPEKQDFDLVANDYSCNMIIAFEQLAALGYSRVGLIMNPNTVNDRAIRWLPGFLECQEYLPRHRRIPMFVRHSIDDRRMGPFVAWLERWKPDVLLSADCRIPERLAGLKLRVPHDIGLAALGVIPDEHWAGIEEDHDTLGSRIVELVASKLERNEFGPPAHPSVTLIPGHWKSGKTIRRIGPPVPSPIEWDKGASRLG